MRVWVWSVLCVVALGFARPGTALAGVYNPEVFQLDNGMQVVVLPNHRAPVVFHMVVYKVGSSDEPPGKSGVAHLLEHLMFKGTHTYPDGEFSKRVAQHGGQENAYTTYDSTGYFQTVASDRLSMVMTLEADRMTNLVLHNDDVVTERAVVLEERNQRIENKPSARLREQSNQKLFPKDHPYGRPIIGWRDELAALAREDVLAFYQDHYAPNNAILLVAGDVDPEQVRTLAQQTYGKIPPAKNVQRTSLVVSADQQVEGGETVLKDARVTQASWSETIVQPSYATGDFAAVAAREVLSELLGGGGTSRLYRALVIDQGIAVSAGTYYDNNARGDGRFGFYASPKPGVSLDDVSEAVWQQVHNLAENGLADDELSRVKTRMIANAVFARDAMKSGAWAIGQALAAGHPIAAVEKWPEHIQGVTQDDVMTALNEILHAQRRIVSKLLPTEQAETEPQGDGS